MKTKQLHEIVAIEKSVKKRCYEQVGKLNTLASKPDYFNGFSRVFQPNDDGGEVFPEENQKVQVTVAQLLDQVVKAEVEALDIRATKDRTNCLAKADIVLADGHILAADVPVTTLLDLEKRLTDWRTLISNLPTLNLAHDWTFEPNSGLFKTKEIKTHKTSKVEESQVVIQPTEQHPGQWRTFTKDVITGYWHKIEHSGAISVPSKQNLIETANQLIDAVKQARERANEVQVVQLNIGKQIFEHLVGNLLK